MAVYYLLHHSLDVGRWLKQVELFETSSDCSDCAFCIHCFSSVYHKLHSKPIGFWIVKKFILKFTSLVTVDYGGYGTFFLYQVYDGVVYSSGTFIT